MHSSVGMSLVGDSGLPECKIIIKYLINFFNRNEVQ
jgi:hypothetical protein